MLSTRISGVINYFMSGQARPGPARPVYIRARPGPFKLIYFPARPGPGPRAARPVQTSNVSSGTLNTTIPYRPTITAECVHTDRLRHCSSITHASFMTCSFWFCQMHLQSLVVKLKGPGSTDENPKFMVRLTASSHWTNCSGRNASDPVLT